MTNKEKFKDTLDSLYKELCDVSDWMYHNPELGFEEYETSKYFCLLYTSDAADE